MCCPGSPRRELSGQYTRTRLAGLGEHGPDDKEILVFDVVTSCFDPDEDVSEFTLTFELAGKDILLRGVEPPPFFRISNRGRH